MNGIFAKTMKNTAPAVLAAVLLFLPGCAGRHAEEPLVIGIIGDQTGTHDLDQACAVMEKAVSGLSAFQPDIVLHVGDMVESVKGIASFEDYRSNFDRAVGIMNRLPSPWLIAAGDHEVNPPGYAPRSADRSREGWFMRLGAEAGLPLEDNLYYSYDFQGYHFVFLYALENLHTDPRWGSIFLNRMSDEQIEWLETTFDHIRTTGE